MIDKLKQSAPGQATGRFLGWAEGLLVPRILRKRTFALAFLASVLAALYWGLWASDRYVSEAHIIIQRTDMASGASADFGALLSGVGGGSRGDQMLLRDHLLSLDMLNKLDAALGLRAHYADPARDPLSRLWAADVEVERFHQHYLKRVAIEFDEYAGVLVLRIQAYDPATAQAMARLLVEEGERYMNELAHRLAREQVAFLERQVADMSARAIEARQALVSYQNKKGMVSPQATVENLAGVINKLEAQLTDLRARRSVLLGYLAPKAPGVVEVDLQIAAVEKQIEQETARLAAPMGGTLNRTVEEYQRLQLEAEFAQEVFRSALVALEKGRIEATRTLKKVSVLQAPTLPEYPLEPRRIYNIVVFVLVTLMLAAVAHLLAAIIRDHKD